jgi:hypothetical protein
MKIFYNSLSKRNGAEKLEEEKKLPARAEPTKPPFASLEEMGNPGQSLSPSGTLWNLIAFEKKKKNNKKYIYLYIYIYVIRKWFR